MTTPEEFDAWTKEFDRRQAETRKLLDSLQVDQGNLAETVANHGERMDRLDDTMTRLRNRVEELAELSEMGDGAMAELWRDYIAHKKGH